MKDLVSIIIPTYKSTDTLSRAINSCLNQSYKNIEIIVVDDNDPSSNYRENAVSIMKTYASDNRVIYIKHEKNKNGSAARNTGISVSSGEYLAFLDDDDYFLEDKIKIELEFLKKNLFDAVTCYYYRNGKIFNFDIKKDYVKEIFFGLTTPQTSSFLLTRKCVEQLNGFDESYFRHQDYEFLLRFFCNDFKLGVIPKPLYVMDYNGIVNVPNGEKMSILKDKFLSQFDYMIDKYSLNKKKVYASNYSVVCFSFLKNGEFSKFFNTLKKHFSVYLVYFIFARFIRSVKYKIVKK